MLWLTTRIGGVGVMGFGLSRSKGYGCIRTPILLGSRTARRTSACPHLTVRRPRHQRGKEPTTADGTNSEMLLSKFDLGPEML